MRLCRYKYVLVFAFAMLIASFSHAQQDENCLKDVNYSLFDNNSDILFSGDTISYLYSIWNQIKMYEETGPIDSIISCGVKACSYFQHPSDRTSGLQLIILSAIAYSYDVLEDYYHAVAAQKELLLLKNYAFENGGVTFDGFVVSPIDIVEEYKILAEYTEKLEDYEITKCILKRAIRLMEDNHVVDSCESALDIYRQLILVYYNENSFEGLRWARYYLNKEIDLCEHRFGKQSSQFQTCLFMLQGAYIREGILHIENNEIQEAYNTFLIVDSIYKINNNTSEYYYFNVLHIASCLEQLGRYAEALEIVEDVEPSIAKDCGEESPIYIMAVESLTSLYHFVSDYKRSNYFQQKTVNLRSKTKKDSSSAAFYYAIAQIHEEKGHADSAEYYYNKSTWCMNDTSLYLIQPYARLMRIYAEDGRAELFDSINGLCVQLLEKHSNNPQINASKQTYLLALYSSELFKNDLDKAEKYLSEVLELFQKNGETHQLRYLEFLAIYIYFSFGNNHKISQPNIFQNHLIETNVNQFFTNYSLLPKEERDSILNDLIYGIVRDMVFSLMCDSSDLKVLYNYLLFNKQLSLNTDIEYARAISDLGRDIISNNQLFTIEQNDAESLHNERNLRNKALNRGSHDWIIFTYDSVRLLLDNKDIAVEYVRYYDYSNYATNPHPIEKYIALITRKGWSEPRYISLCKADDLNKYTSPTPEKKYDIYGGSYVSEEIVRLLFDPIKEYTKKGGHVYFAPDGVLYNLAIENILTDGGMTLGEKYGLVRCSSTRNIAQIYNQPQYASAVLYGGLDYGDVADFVAEATTRKDWILYLPGTLQEVNTIGKTLSRHRVKTKIITGEEGTEKSFVQLSDKGNSIIHLATHGFFLTSTDSRKETYFDNLRQRGLLGNNQSQTEEISPMQRSGLILSGGKRAWWGEKESEGSEDGVLLASEVMNMNLFGTKLLVLSACETGLGDMSVEGIMGLQRAFKLAGVETIVMSLWKVDDEATTMMMEQFYKNLMSGKSKRKAFSLAQQKVRKKYPAEPKKWAAFIMLD